MVGGLEAEYSPEHGRSFAGEMESLGGPFPSLPRPWLWIDGSEGRTGDAGVQCSWRENVIIARRPRVISLLDNTLTNQRPTAAARDFISTAAC